MIGNIAGLIAYASARGVSIGADEAPVLLTKATDYMNSFEWAGTRPAGQEDSWPRNGIAYNGEDLLTADGETVHNVDDGNGGQRPIANGDVPAQPVTPMSIVSATYRAAMVIGSGIEVQGTTSAAKVLEERVEGAVSVKYAESTVTGDVVIPGFDALIAPWTGYSANNGINFSVMRG